MRWRNGTMHVHRSTTIHMRMLVLAATLTSSMACGDAGSGPTELTLSVGPKDGTTQTVSLTCDPPGGTHGHKADACADLAKVNGDFTTLAMPSGKQCTLELDPQEAEVKGSWRGQQVDRKQEYSNRCVLTTVTGSIFQF
ncbi:hypothetical protein D5S17_19405 [Pseudonocardiaceae bacterium YIM PH 21723]|nr:hypothetical protein D5S17_19405 [Pseudonocardiaceae bacterium YIM PH 21723]